MVNRALLPGMLTNFTVVFIFAETLMAALFIVPDLGGSYATTGYTLAFYAMGNVMAIPLGDKFHPLKLLRFCFAGMILSTLCAYLATNYPFFNLFRFAQGFCAGPLYILIPLLTSDLKSAQGRGIYIRNFVICYITASTAGGCLAGAIAYGYRWRWIGILDLLFLLPAACWFLWEVRNKEVEKPAKKLDPLGYLLYALNIAIALTFLTLGQELDWFRSHFLDTLFYLFCITFPYFIFHTWGHPHPILDFTLFKIKELTFAVAMLASFMSAYFGMTTLLAIWLHLYINYSADYVLVLLAILTGSAAAVLFYIVRMQHQRELTLVWIALLLMLGAAFFTMNFNVNVNFGRIALSHILFGSALPLFLPPVVHLLLDSIKKGRVLQGIAFFQTTRVLFSALGIAIYANVWQRRSYFYHSRLGGELTSFSVKTRLFLERFKLFYLTDKQGDAEMSAALEIQAQSLAINDTFMLIGVLLLLTLLAIPFYLKQRRNSPFKQSADL